MPRGAQRWPRHGWPGIRAADAGGCSSGETTAGGPHAGPQSQKGAASPGPAGRAAGPSC